jgi:tetratricopeptide (TPR) repeat protein
LSKLNCAGQQIHNEVGQKKNAEVYALLERNYLGDSLYEERVLQWALWYFLSQRQWKEAEQLFIPYLTTKYGEHSKDAKDEVVIVFDPYNRIAEMRSWEREYLSYFVAEYKKDLMLAYRLLVYEFENGQISTRNEKKDFTQRDRLPLFINLGNMYFGLKQTEKAIELYSLASSQAKSDKQKSEIHYRLALINLHKQEIKNALLNAEYSILLDPNNTEARLLYKKLKD